LSGRPVLEAAGLSYTYPDGRKAVDAVSLALAGDESLALIGPNGAGKTTLLLLLAGILEPGEGEVAVLGRKFGGRDDREIRRSLGVVFQETEDQLFSPTVFDDVAFGPLNFGMSADETRRRVEDALRKVGFEGCEGRNPHRLSSGERRRAAIASVLSYGPGILLLDEPSNDLDPRGKRDLARWLRAAPEAVILASHDLELVLRTCDRAILLDGGRVHAAGPVLDVLSDRALLERHGLEAPLGLRGRTAAEIGEILREDALGG
jgi:cobalt/nickel transport system ATP-binding protein